MSEEAGERAIERAEGLMERLEHAKRELERTADPEKAIEIMAELAQIAKDVEAEIERARQEADAQP